jgi:hypothetical protein
MDATASKNSAEPTIHMVAGTLASLGFFLYIVATEKYEKRV